MFEEEILLGDTERSIVLETRAGRRIKNTVEPEPGEQQRRAYAYLQSKNPRWTNRKPACGGYNCFGMAFACRRTSIFEVEDVRHILKDDGYRKSSLTDPRVGDLVLYCDRLTGEAHHVAIIMGIELAKGTEISYRALSKWNSSYGEDFHEIYDHPMRDLDIEVSFWTDRP